MWTTTLRRFRLHDPVVEHLDGDARAAFAFAALAHGPKVCCVSCLGPSATPASCRSWPVWLSCCVDRSCCNALPSKSGRGTQSSKRGRGNGSLRGYGNRALAGSWGKPTSGPKGFGCPFSVPLRNHVKQPGKYSSLAQTYGRLSCALPEGSRGLTMKFGYT